MPVPRAVLNAFTAEEVKEISGLSKPMIDYLARMRFLRPAYRSGAAARGSVRYYSYRDLVAARLVQRLRESGVQLSKLKKAIELVRRDATWSSSAAASERLAWLVSDGKEVLLKSEDGFLDTFRPDRQRVFTFVVNLPQLESEVRQLIPDDKRTEFSMRNKPLRYGSG